MLHTAFDTRCVAPITSYSPSAAKPGQVMRDWDIAGLEIKNHAVTPATATDLYLAHDVDYVRGVMRHEIDNGFGNRDPDVSASLPWTVGAMLTAARLAISLRRPVCAPVSGFHHAGFDFGGGYCTFNGLVVAALSVLQEGLCDHVHILDFDHHWGNGTDDCLARADLSLAGRVTNHSVGKLHLGPTDARHAMAYLRRSIGHVLSDPRRKLVLYQAGADMHFDDPLGGCLSTAQMLERDCLVFGACRDHGIPIAWNLAGGYQKDADGSIPKVLELHRNTAKASLE